MQIAQKAMDRVESHEEVCGLRYAAIDKSITSILRILVWGGVTAFTIIVGLLGWSLNQQFQANLQARAEAAAKIEMLERQLADRVNVPPVTVVK